MTDDDTRQPGHSTRTQSAKAELYRRFGKQVFALSLADQWQGDSQKARPRSDAEIARELGLTEDEVTDVRCIAESGLLDPAWFREADEFKRRPR